MRGMTLAPFLLIAAAARAADVPWPQFRGPNAQGVSADTGLPVEFGPDRNLIWKTPLPPGHSSPVVTRDRVFVTAFEGRELATFCLRRSDGRVLWRRGVERSRENPIRKPNNPASATPVTDGVNVFAFFQDFGLVSYDASGRERWRVPMGPFRVYYGHGASPILADGAVILPVDQDGGGSYLTAIDARTGRERWRTRRPEVISGYSTPVIHGKELLLAESFQLSAYSIATGERTWFVPGLACEMKSVPAIAEGRAYINGWGFPENQPGRQIAVDEFDVALARQDADKDGKLSIAEMPHERLKNRGYFGTFDLDADGFLNRAEWGVARAMLASENGLLAIALGGGGNRGREAILWSYRKPVPQVPSTLLYRGVLFMVNDSGILLSIDPATGNVLKQDRLKGAIDKYFASPVGADGKVWLVSQDGTVSVVAAQGRWETLAVNSLGEEVFATPAIAGGRIYVRTAGGLMCFGSRPPR